MSEQSKAAAAKALVVANDQVRELSKAGKLTTSDVHALRNAEKKYEQERGR